ncbi:MAG: sulfatase-like hydrolase/transferase, partial [Gemmatimonadota bacterium]
MNGSGSRGARVAAGTLAALGLLTIGYALLADVIGGGEPGFGFKQWLLLGVGAVLFVAGILLSFRRCREYLTRWRTPPDEPEPVEGLLSLLVCVAVPAGLVDCLLSLSGYRFFSFGRQWWWMAPLSYVLFLAVPGLVIALFSRAGLRRLGSIRAAAFLYVFVSFVGLLYYFQPELHWIAAAVLAAGLARIASALVARHRAGVRAIAGRTAVALVVFVTLLGIGSTAGRAVIERRKVAALPTPPAGAPNVLLIILDTVRAANLGLYGHQRETTPALERFAAGGVTFDLAISPAAWTLPSHASMFTGRHPHELSATIRHPLDDRWPTLAGVLGARGYRTGGFVANRYYAGPHTGLARGFLRYDFDMLSPGEILDSSSLGRLVWSWTYLRRLVLRNVVGPGGEAPDWERLGRKRAADVADEFLRWVGDERDRPFFAFLNLYDAHDPYLPPAPFARRFMGDGQALPPRDGRLDPAIDADSIRSLTDAYDGAIAYMDEELGSLFDRLEARGLLDGTIVIVASDHGEELGEHAVIGHGFSLYLSVVHVPLVIRYPASAPAGLRVPAPVGLRDLPATIFDLAGLPGGELPGRSLARAWSDEAGSVEDTVLTEGRGRPWLSSEKLVSRGDMRSLLAGDMHYIRYGDATEELFRPVEDPWELDDLRDDPGSAASVSDFRRTLGAYPG